MCGQKLSKYDKKYQTTQIEDVYYTLKNILIKNIRSQYLILKLEIKILKISMLYIKI